MPPVFLDTSALARRYFVGEPGAARVMAILAGPGPALGSQIASIEFASALARKVREGAVGESDRDRLWRAFKARLRASVRLIPIDREVVESAERLHLGHAVRTLDSIQIACAAKAARIAADADEELLFVTADRRQAEVATSAGLKIELLQ